MANRGIELGGVDMLVDQLRQRARAASKRLEAKALQEAGRIMATEMERRAPRSNLTRNYHLQDNIVVSRVRSKDGVRYVEIGPNKKVAWRAHFVEFGTSTQPAKPYIEPAFRATNGEALRLLADELRKGLRD